MVTKLANERENYTGEKPQSELLFVFIRPINYEENLGSEIMKWSYEVNLGSKTMKRNYEVNLRSEVLKLNYGAKL